MGSTALTGLLLGGGVMGFLGAVFTAIYTRKNMRADTAQKISDASGGLLDQFRTSNNELAARLQRSERMTRATRGVLMDLLEDVKAQGIDVEPYRVRLERAEEYTPAERAALPEASE